MKRSLFALLALMAALFVIGCGAPAAEEEGSPEAEAAQQAQAPELQ